MMTATATAKTLRLLKDQFPEISKWKTILNSSLRENVTQVVPPPEILPSNLENLLEPFLHDIKRNKKSYLVLIRGSYQMDT